ncbi:MAG: metal ABC transporter permease [Lachnospiraceae bacterium]|nr:metal ABC transporter permease [Lachnospiraceae bacterium]
MIESLQFYLEFPFVRRALLVGVLIAFCSSLLGVTLVLKRYSFIGDGLSHVAFAAMSIAMVMSLSNNMLLILPVTIVSAILMLKTGNNTKINGDAIIAMMSVASLAIGYMVVNKNSDSPNVAGDVCSTLFGATSILTLSELDVILCIAMSIIVLVFYLLFYNKIFAVTFDEDFAKATGVRAGAYNMLMAVITAVIIVLAMNLVGSLLISALVIFPALSAMRVFKNFKAVVICSGILSIISSVLGLFISLLETTPVGSTIVVVDITVFIIFAIVGMFIRGVKE